MKKEEGEEEERKKEKDAEEDAKITIFSTQKFCFLRPKSLPLIKPNPKSSSIIKAENSNCNRRRGKKKILKNQKKRKEKKRKERKKEKKERPRIDRDKKRMF